MNEYDGNWITTYTGKKFHYLNPSLDEIDIRDIAHALAMKCRFGGHCKQFYSVAEHSIRVMKLVPGRLRLSALLHDATEAYMPDVPRPIKVQFGLKVYERIIASTIRAKFGIYDYPVIKDADNILLATEARDLMNNTCDWADLPEPLPEVIEPMVATYAEACFLSHCEELGLQVVYQE